MLANQIKYLRKSHGLSQAQLADKLGVKKQSVSNWENDNILPSIELVLKIAVFFDVSTDYLLFGKDRISTGNSMLDVTGLNPNQINHVREIINDIRNS